ncbi:MAG: hypothetical protein II873_07325 [Oscillospiraceae bacterium]|nr:hypothetical protein [Oscillospiraceae bacterium]
MMAFTCKSCGSNDFREEGNYRICNYCGTKHIITVEDRQISPIAVDLQDDVSRLLAKCIAEPARAKKYAQRILEIDPNNVEARRILAASMQKNQSSGGGCYVATAVYGSYDCPQVWTLRRYRDDVLAKSWYGRAFIRTYYAVSPVLVSWFGETEWFRSMWKPTLDQMVKCMNEKGVEGSPYQDINW